MMRKVAEKVDGARMARVYWNADTREYVVRLYKDGVLYAAADYFTDDKQDAVVTMLAMVAGEEV